MNKPDPNQRVLGPLTRRELIDATKAAFKEMVREAMAEFGRWSLKTLGVLLIGAVIVFVLWANGYVKGHQ